MQSILYAVTLASTSISLVTSPMHADPVLKRIVIENRSGENVRPGAIEFSPTGSGIAYPQKGELRRVPGKEITKWVIESAQPLLLSSPSVFGSLGNTVMVEAGDSIRIETIGGETVYSGKGAEKFNILADILQKTAEVILPANPRYYSTTSLADYLEWHHYLNKQEKTVINILDSNKKALSDVVFRHIKYTLLSKMEDRRVKKFGQLRKHAAKFSIRESELCAIFDTSLNNEAANWLLSLTQSATGSVYYYEYIRTLYNRMNGFSQADSIRLSPTRKLAYYNLAKEKLKDDILGLYLTFLIPKEVLKEQGYNLTTIEILEDFYQYPGLKKYKEYVRQQENMLIRNSLQQGKHGPQFDLPDINGNIFSPDLLQGKIAVFHFPCEQAPISEKDAGLFSTLKNEFSVDSSIIFINVLPATGDTTAGGTTLVAGEHYAVFKKIFQVSENPKYHIIDGDGKNVFSTEAGPNDAYMEDIRNHLYREIVASSHDGPYVSHLDDAVVVHYINGQEVSTDSFSGASTVPLYLVIDKSTRLTFSLIKEHQPEPCIFDKPEKILAISDIEGNFHPFVKLLKANKVVDDNYNWIFGRNHLVLNGDFFDRGNQVTECLWLIYALEQSARKAGGYVHFILGNHEIMNLGGDTRYVHDKYIQNARKLNVPYNTLLHTDSELGKWLRTKNIMEKIGDILFVHGGISPEINKLGLPIDQINEIARAHYAADSLAVNEGNYKTSIIAGSNASPFWYREYYKNARNDSSMMLTVHATLEKFGVNRIITGHTVVGGNISVHHQGKIINIDTPHAKGFSEALLVTGDKYFRTSFNQPPVQLEIK